MSDENPKIVDMATGKVIGEVRPGYHVEPKPWHGPIKVVRVTATVTFEAYALTEGFHGGRSLEAQVAAEIMDAIAYRAVHGTDTEEGDALIAMTTYPDFAVDVRGIEVSVLDRPVNLSHVVEQAEGTTGSWL
jgi:hypothetical protein